MSLDEQENLLPGEVGAEDESPYLRRQKAVAVRRSRFSRRLRWAFFVIAVLLPVGFTGYYLARFALTSPRFLLNSADDVTVVGNRFVSREEVLNAVGLPPSGVSKWGVNIFRFPLAARRKQVESIAWVRSATLTRVYPHRLVVQVVERTPVAFVNLDGRVSLVDGDGVLLDKPEDAAFDFPVLTGLDAAPSPDERRSRLALYEQYMSELQPEAPRSGWLISEVDVADIDDLKALLVQGRQTLQVHFGHKDFLERFRTFLALLPELRKSHGRLNSVDLRYRNQIVVNPQPVAPAPQGQTPAAAGALKE